MTVNLHQNKESLDFGSFLYFVIVYDIVESQVTALEHHYFAKYFRYHDLQYNQVFVDKLVVI